MFDYSDDLPPSQNLKISKASKISKTLRGSKNQPQHQNFTHNSTSRDETSTRLNTNQISKIRAKTPAELFHKINLRNTSQLTYRQRMRKYRNRKLQRNSTSCSNSLSAVDKKELLKQIARNKSLHSLSNIGKCSCNSKVFKILTCDLFRNFLCVFT